MQLFSGVASHRTNFVGAKKDALVREKTSAYLWKNDGLFLVKRRVVLWQMTCRFFSAV